MHRTYKRQQKRKEKKQYLLKSGWLSWQAALGPSIYLPALCPDPKSPEGPKNRPSPYVKTHVIFLSISLYIYIFFLKSNKLRKKDATRQKIEYTEFENFTFRKNTSEAVLGLPHFIKSESSRSRFFVKSSVFLSSSSRITSDSYTSVLYFQDAPCSPLPQFLQNIWKLYLSYRRRFRNEYPLELRCCPKMLCWPSTLWNWGVVQRCYAGRVQGPKIWNRIHIDYKTFFGRVQGPKIWNRILITKLSKPPCKNPASIDLSFFIFRFFFSLFIGNLFCSLLNVLCTPKGNFVWHHREFL
jgi:hypothetical protein